MIFFRIFFRIFLEFFSIFFRFFFKFSLDFFKMFLIYKRENFSSMHSEMFFFIFIFDSFVCFDFMKKRESLRLSHIIRPLRI